MLSAKCAKIQGMKDGRWTIKDKINQYRGILKLHARDKKVRAHDAPKLKKRISKELKGLINDVKEYRGILRDVEFGETRRMHAVLHEHRDFQLAYENLTPKEVEDGVFQDSSLKRRQLDKLYYQKKKKMKEFFDLKLECAILSDKYEREQEYGPNYQEQQRLVAGYQQFMAKQNAAKSIRTTYQAMVKILQKDAIHFDAILECLKEDRRSQCKVLLKATVMGQLAAENLDDTREKYKLLEREVWINMKERERTLNEVRAQVEDLWAYAQSLIRVESDTELNERDPKKKKARHVDILDRQISQLEDIFDRVKDSLAIRSYEEFLSRLEAQIKQKSRLLAQFNKNFKERDDLLNAKSHALLSLATLEHSMLTTTGQYKSEKKAMLEEIEVQKQREIEYRNIRKARGELLIKIRAAFQNMLTMLICVKQGTGRSSKKGLEKKPTTQEQDERKSREEETRRELIPVQMKFGTDALSLLSQLSTKANTLFAMSGADLDPVEEEKARDLYQRYIADYQSKINYGDGEPEPTGIVVEHDIVDTSVQSRADIKLLSKQVVEAHTKND